jgi:hypothetical protein
MIATMPVYDERKHAFSGVRNERVLIYWPHGFGDFVHFGYVAPLLEPTNEYFITRFGDDFVHLYDGARGIAPVESGVRATGDGSAQSARHLGIDWKRIRNRPADVLFPQPLASRIETAKITTLLYTDYPEVDGRQAFPFQTKARSLIRRLVAPERLKTIDMTKTLQNAVAFDAPAESRVRVEARLRDFVAAGERLYLVAPGGHTSPGKIWPRENVERFARALPSFDSRARFLLLDEPSLRAGFADLDVPFAHLLVTLLAHAHAVVGVPAGPLHAALAIRRSAVVGIWLAHHPDWYDEPYRDALHLTGPLVERKRFSSRKATRTSPPQVRARTIAFPLHPPDADDVLAALELLR